MASVPEFNLYQPHHKPEPASKPYRDTAYTCRQFARLTHAQQMSIDCECEARDKAARERKKPNAG